MRELVREEEARVVVEGHRIVAPRQWRRRQRLVEDREIRRAVAAGQIAFRDREREAVVRRIAKERRVERQDIGRAVGEPSRSAELARVRLDEHADRPSLRIIAIVRRSGLAGHPLAGSCRRRRQIEPRRVEPVEAADDAREIPRGLRGVEDELLGGPLSGRQRIHERRALPVACRSRPRRTPPARRS